MNRTYYTSTAQRARTNKVYSRYLQMKNEAENFLRKLKAQKEKSLIWQRKYQNLLRKANKFAQKNSTQNTEENVNPDYVDNYQQDINNNENYDQNNNDINDIDINEEYEKMIARIEELEQLNMDYNSFNNLNHIKTFINDKGDNITIEEIYTINDALERIVEILQKKEMKKIELENCEQKILEKKQMINQLENNDMNNNNEEEDNNEEYDGEENIDDNNGNNEEEGDEEENIQNNCEEVEELDEEYENESTTKQNKMKVN